MIASSLARSAATSGGFDFPVFNRFPNSRERQVIISRKFLRRAWFLGIDMRPIQQFGANPRVFDEELAIKGCQSRLQVLVRNTCTHTCSVAPWLLIRRASQRNTSDRTLSVFCW